MGQLFGRRANGIFRVSLAAGFLLLILGLAVLMLLPLAPYRTRVGVFVKQDIPFSHEHHVAEIGIDCRFCHASVEKSPYAGIPQTQTCMKCHGILFSDAPMLAPVRESFRTGQRLIWNRVYDLPDYAYFNHSIHVRSGVSCRTCHGNVDRMPWMMRAKKFYMGTCLACHDHAGAYVKGTHAETVKELRECSTCHR